LLSGEPFHAITKALNLKTKIGEDKMNWDAIGAVGELIGAIAVVITLVYLAIQIRQNTKTVRASTYQSVAEALADGSYKLVGHFDTDTDKVLLFVGTLRRYENLHFQLRQGNIAEEDAETFYNSLAIVLRDERWEGYWPTCREMFSRSFVEHIEEKVLPETSGMVNSYQASVL
jgi:hypothetical protein